MCQKAELEAVLAEFCYDRGLDRLECVVLVSGRGMDHIAYSQHFMTAATALALTEGARLTLAKKVLAEMKAAQH